ncbi:helix-turn-helix domain-containing protein [Ruminococcus sp.]|uniref:helix-turn-helix domain-containing protein n=1 Tax=Ruminococcus sp. TaxID=41978 RepID=UPI002E76E382|nr:helix-turn-helix transcriptional regulator [Ruminococcus sp.]MEE1263836.1 helix-turn-helix transcriptional regulator [Ruminococcus sp.]
MSSYGERLMRARKEKELTREELGKLCGITGRTIQNYELGHVTPNRIDVSQRLADVLDISVDYLIYGEKEETELTEEDKKEILAHASALFAGGKLSDEEQLAFIYELQTLYMKARQIIKDREDEQ